MLPRVSNAVAAEAAKGDATQQVNRPRAYPQSMNDRPSKNRPLQSDPVRCASYLLAGRAQSYAGCWVTRRSGDMVCRGVADLDAVVEPDLR